MVSHKNERKTFIDYVKNKNNYDNHIFVFDRGFDGFQFYKSLESNEIKYLFIYKIIKVINIRFI